MYFCTGLYMTWCWIFLISSYYDLLVFDGSDITMHCKIQDKIQDTSFMFPCIHSSPVYSFKIQWFNTNKTNLHLYALHCTTLHTYMGSCARWQPTLIQAMGRLSHKCTSCQIILPSTVNI